VLSRLPARHHRGRELGLGSALGESPLLRGTNFFGAKSAAVLVASKLEATAWNDFPNMGSFSPGSRLSRIRRSIVYLRRLHHRTSIPLRLQTGNCQCLPCRWAFEEHSHWHGCVPRRWWPGASRGTPPAASRLRRSVATMYAFPGAAADPAKSLRPRELRGKGQLVRVNHLTVFNHWSRL
jgi:hypothetical protein